MVVLDCRQVALCMVTACKDLDMQANAIYSTSSRERASGEKPACKEAPLFNRCLNQRHDPKWPSQLFLDDCATASRTSTRPTFQNADPSPGLLGTAATMTHPDEEWRN